MIKLDVDTLRYIAALENSSGAEVKDCIVSEGSVIYIIKEGQLGMAVGKNGVNVKKICSAIGKRVHVVEFSSDPVKFICNMFSTLTINNVSLDENKKLLIEADYKTRGSILGKGGKKIQILKELLRRHHGVSDVVVK